MQSLVRSAPTPDLLGQNLHFNGIRGVIPEHLRSEKRCAGGRRTSICPHTLGPGGKTSCLRFRTLCVCRHKSVSVRSWRAPPLASPLTAYAVNLKEQTPESSHVYCVHTQYTYTRGPIPSCFPHIDPELLTRLTRLWAPHLRPLGSPLLRTAIFRAAYKWAHCLCGSAPFLKFT